MANVCDYVRWRGDLTLEQSEFNEIDKIVISSEFEKKNLVENYKYN